MSTTGKSQNDANAVLQALERSRKGDVKGALTALEDCVGPEALGMRFHFAMFLDDHKIALEVCRIALNDAGETLAQSTWYLRRARAALYAAEHERLSGPQENARKDLIKVIGLRASDDHVQQAQRILLSMAKVS